MILSTILLFACENTELSDYRCNQSQLKQLKQEFDACISTEFYKSFCYEQLRKAYCEKIEEGEEYTLDAQAYPDYLLSRFLGTAETEADLKEMNKTMRAIYKHLGFKFTEQE